MFASLSCSDHIPAHEHVIVIFIVMFRDGDMFAT